MTGARSSIRSSPGNKLGDNPQALNQLANEVNTVAFKTIRVAATIDPLVPRIRGFRLALSAAFEVVLPSRLIEWELMAGVSKDSSSWSWSAARSVNLETWDLSTAQALFPRSTS